MGDLKARLQGILGNRWAKLGLVGAVGLGALSLARRGPGGGADPDPGSDIAGDTDATSVGAGGSAAATYPNTSSTDLATAVGDMDSRYAEQVAGFSTQLGTDHEALTALQTSSTETATGLASLVASNQAAAAATAASAAAAKKAADAAAKKKAAAAAAAKKKKAPAKHHHKKKKK